MLPKQIATGHDITHLANCLEAQGFSPEQINTILGVLNLHPPRPTVPMSPMSDEATSPSETEHNPQALAILQEMILTAYAGGDPELGEWLASIADDPVEVQRVTSA